MLRRLLPWVGVLVALMVFLPARWGGPFGFTIVAGDSMLPTMKLGDLVVTYGKTDFQVGDVIVYQPPGLEGHYVIHRITQVRSDGTYETKGDNRTLADEWYPGEDDVLGKMVFRVPKCTLAACNRLGLPFLIFTLLMAMAAGFLTFDISYRGRRVGGIPLPEGTRPLAPTLVSSLQLSESDLSEVLLPARMMEGLAAGEFVLHYQPQVSLPTGNVRSLEVLLRWHHPRLGLLSPGVFLPAAERSGVILEIEDWAIDTALAQLRAWRGQGLPDLAISLNLSPRHWEQGPAFIDRLRSTMTAYDIPPDAVSVEMTAPALATDSERDWGLVSGIERTGVEVALDAGHASLWVLDQPVRSEIKTIKIDRRTVQELVGRNRRAAELGRRLANASSQGFQIVGEGVESKQELEALLRSGATAYQGYLFSPALPAREIPQLLYSSVERA